MKSGNEQNAWPSRKKQRQELQARRLKQKQEREKRELELQVRVQEFNNQCKTLLAMYEAMDHPEVNNYTADVNCSAPKIVDDVFDVTSCNDA